MMEEKRKFNIKPYLISGAISLALGIGFFCLFFFISGKTKGYKLVNWQDSTMITGVILVCIGGLMWIGREGLFDIFAYGFKQLGSFLFSRKPSEYNDFPGYKDEKRTLRKSSPKLYVSVLIVGAFILLTSLVLYIAIKSIN